jgi:UPF0755 protein
MPWPPLTFWRIICVKTYSLAPKRHSPVPRRIWVLLAVVACVVVGGAAVVQRSYYANLHSVSDSTQRQYITIASGSSLSKISKQLQTAGLIRSSQAFEWYVSVHNERDKLQAGTYSFTPNQSTPAIAEAIANGKIATDLVTILSGQRLDQVRQAFIKSGFHASAVDAALSAGQYRSSYPALADNPASANLEGFLYPDSYQKTADTDPKQIIAESLTEMQRHLTTDIRNGFAAHGLTVYQGVALASIVEQEVPSQVERNQAAQVFVKRLQVGMPLGSDVTANYGAIKAGVAPALDYDSTYNTLLHKGLPPGPIGTVSDSSLQAVAHPAATDWLYFVTGDDGTTRFAKTLDEHNANVSKYCHKSCNQAA